MIIPIDELNLPGRNSYKNTKGKAITWLTNFFTPTHWNEDEIKNRVQIAEEILDAVEVMYNLFYILQPFDTDLAKKDLQVSIRNTIYEHGYYDQTMEDYSGDIAELIVLTTVAHSSEPYYFSHDRAIEIAANETLSIVNYKDVQDHIDRGYTHKVWITMGDERVRQTHNEVDGMEVPINGYFPVGEHLLYMPHDFRMMDIAPEEILNCRCSLWFW